MKPVTQAWLIKAGEDLEAIRTLRGNPQLTGVIAFHAQQCVEKCLKAVAEERVGIMPRGELKVSGTFFGRPFRVYDAKAGGADSGRDP